MTRTEIRRFGDVAVHPGDDFVVCVEIQRPPHNYFDLDLVEDLASALEGEDEDMGCRVIVLCAEGKNFCAGAKLGGGEGERSRIEVTREDGSPRHLYDAALRLMKTRKPIVVAVQGAAIGGGLGLALVPDFRIADTESTFAANFARLGFHQGFGLSITLPDLVGRQKAMDLLYTGRRIRADEALAIGLVDRVVPPGGLREAATLFAREIAASAPLAVRSIRETLRAGLVDRFRVATDREKLEQDRLRRTEDYAAGVAAMGERRNPDFRER